MPTRRRIDTNKQREEMIRSLNRSADKGFDAFADKLGSILNQVWTASSIVAISKVTRFLRAEDIQFSTRAAADIDRMMQKALSTDLKKFIRPIMRAASVISYSIGGSEMDVGVIKSFSLVDKQAIKWLEDHTMFWSLSHYDRHVTKRLGRLTKRVIEQGMSRRDAGRFFQNTIGKELKRSESYWRGTADAIATRGRAFGSISAMQRAGALEYKIDAVMDHRTSKICKHLNNKVFRVSDAVRIRELIVNAETPEESKRISPWLKPEEIVGKSTDDLALRGVVLPPFHWYCRSRVVIVSIPKRNRVTSSTITMRQRRAERERQRRLAA